MLNRKSLLLVCLPLLAIPACGDDKKKSKSPAPQTTDVVPAPTQPTDDNQSSGNQETPSLTDGSCEERIIDFEKRPDGSAFEKGEKLKDQYAAWGIRFSSRKRQSDGKFVEQAPILFDSAERPDGAAQSRYLEISSQYGNADGFDWDLITSSNGKVLIIAEHMYDALPADAADRVTYPDDNNFGGLIRVTFDRPAQVKGLDFVDMEDGDNAIELWKDGNGKSSRIARQSFVNKGNNSLQKLQIENLSFVDRVEVIVATGGAIDSLKVCVKK